MTETKTEKVPTVGELIGWLGATDLVLHGSYPSCREAEAIRRLIRLAPLYEKLVEAAEKASAYEYWNEDAGTWIYTVDEKERIALTDALAAIEAEKEKP